MASLSRDQQELLELLAGELQNQLELSLSQGEADPDAGQLEAQADQCGHFAEACEQMGLPGLGLAWQQLHGQLAALAREPSAINPARRQLLDSWLIYFLDYVQQLGSSNSTQVAAGGLSEFLANPAWPQPLSQPDQLTEALARIAPPPARESDLPRQANATMLSLALTEDVNPDLLEGLMLELPQQVNQFADQVNRYLDQSDSQALAAAQRIAHTIKGAANVVGISGLANLMHLGEDLLEELGRQPRRLNPQLGQHLVDLGDGLAAMLDALVEGQTQVAEALPLMQTLLDDYHSLRDGEAPEGDATAAPLDQSTPTAGIDGDSAAEPSAATNQLQENLASQLRVRETTAQELLRLAGTSAISTHRLQTQVGGLELQLRQLQQLQQRLGQLTEELGQQIERQDFFRRQLHRLKDEELDPLEMDRYSELHSFFHQLQEYATDSRDSLAQARQQLRSVEEETYAQQQTNRDVQSLLLDMRMVPARSLEPRFQRCVRQACRLTGKQARLILENGDTLVDNALLQALLDPIMHLLRNAVDHGLEDDETRLAAGKSPEGNIWLGFRNQGQSLVVSLRDDGAGLNRDKILARATQMGLIEESAAIPHEGELQQLIFTPGFSTSERVSHTSGRGIGLDMVADRVHSLKGRINLESEEGAGCRFHLRLPMTLVAEQGLLVKLGDQSLAVSSRGVVQLLFLDSQDLEETPEGLVYPFGTDRLKVLPLASLAPLHGASFRSAREAQALLIVESLPGQQLAVAVDRVTASREMVVKPLPVHTPPISGVIGATILGDGQVAPVVDLQQLAIDLLTGDTRDRWDQRQASSETSITQPPLALIVDDSLSTRRSLSQFAADLGLDVATAKDGFEAIEVIDQRLPALMLVDMEMPRMNGLELCAHLRAREETRHLPIIMITSRNSDKHRQLARQAGVDYYLCKPFAEDELQACIDKCFDNSRAAKTEAAPRKYVEDQTA